MADESKVIDAVDRRIVDILAREGRMSWRDLGELVHLSASSAAERVRRLERAGVIAGYRATIDPASLGRTLRAVIDVGLPAGGDPAEFEARLAGRPEVTFAAYVTGPADYTVLADCAGAEGLDALVRWLKAEGGAARTESKVVLRNVIG